MPIKVARIFNTYGPGMRPDDGRVVSNFIVQALAGSPLTVFGDGSQPGRSATSTIMVDGLIRLMDTPYEVTGPINLGNPHEFTMLELAKVIELVGGRPVEYRPAPADDPIQRRPEHRRLRSCWTGSRRSTSTRVSSEPSITSASCSTQGADQINPRKISGSCL